MTKCSWCGGKSVWVSGRKAACNKHFKILLDEDDRRKEKGKERGDKDN